MPQRKLQLGAECASCRLGVAVEVPPGLSIGRLLRIFRDGFAAHPSANDCAHEHFIVVELAT